ncbi:hypothetical protein [Desulfolucanica intricata]|uniref:hypothetical protein n=1 Tax=Desulfolucanica intricata TaxID=1285191 RepID=UPI000A9B561D|nr:hypothetical protein [Desulfolucanica intricata]
MRSSKEQMRIHKLRLLNVVEKWIENKDNLITLTVAYGILTVTGVYITIYLMIRVLK